MIELWLLIWVSVYQEGCYDYETFTSSYSAIARYEEVLNETNAKRIALKMDTLEKIHYKLVLIKEQFDIQPILPELKLRHTIKPKDAK